MAKKIVLFDVMGTLVDEPFERVMEGLWDHSLEELLRDPPAEVAKLTPADRIVRSAVAESGRDNATALVIEVLAGEP